VGVGVRVVEQGLIRGVRGIGGCISRWRVAIRARPCDFGPSTKLSVVDDEEEVHINHKKGRIASGGDARAARVAPFGTD
jgi:hypothetical protein